MKWKSRRSTTSHNPSTTTTTLLLLPLPPPPSPLPSLLSQSPAWGMDRRWSKVYRWGREGGSQAFARDPSDPEIDTRASQPHREKKRHAHPSALRPQVHLARHVTARVVGGLAMVQGLRVSWLPTPSGCSANAENKEVFTERVLAPRPRLFARLWCLCLCVFCGVMGWFVLGESTPITHLLSDRALMMHRRRHFCQGNIAIVAPLPSLPPLAEEETDLQPGVVLQNLGGSEAFAPDPADPEIDTRAKPAWPHREKKRHARDRACGWWVGGWPKVLCFLAGNPQSQRKPRRT